MMRHASKSRGFSLVEVLVALVVVSIGLLGLAKMQSVALASTTVSGTRSIVAIEAASLAAMMHANPDYWQNNLVPQTTTISYNNNPFSGAIVCMIGGAGAGTNACTPTQMAQYDLDQWAIAVKKLLPVFTSTITCKLVTTAPGNSSISCVIQVQWPENAVAMDANQSNIANLNLSTNNMIQYSLYVQP